jgi:HlyD family type I secretion membrane fusion protein
VLLRLIQEEISDLSTLLEKSLVPKSRVLSLQREEARLLLQIERARLEEKKIEKSISEEVQRIDQTKEEFVLEALSQLKEVEEKLNSARNEVEKSDQVIARSVMRSPVSGTIQNLQVFTVGGVVPPGATLLEIAPNEMPVIARVKISARDIDEIDVGLTARVRLTTIPGQQVAPLDGVVVSVSRDVLTETDENGRKDGRRFYLGQIKILPETSKDKKQYLVSGLPVEAIIRLRKRSFADFLIEPLSWRLGRAMHER